MSIKTVVLYVLISRASGESIAIYDTIEDVRALVGPVKDEYRLEKRTVTTSIHIEDVAL